MWGNLPITDWLVLLLTISAIVGYGIYATRKKQSADEFLMGEAKISWWKITLSVMATQASAITFISVPGQAYNAGLGFIQFYYGLPLAMLFLGYFIVPLFKENPVQTAYQYLEKRFDLNTRLLTSGLFLLQRGLGTGLTIYAPSVVLSTVLGGNLEFTIFGIGLLVILYTVLGGNKAVAVTHQYQMIVILSGMALAAAIAYFQIEEKGSVQEQWALASALGKTNIANFSTDLGERYTVWSGLIAGFFLQLSYFGTDQSQVGRYLGSESVQQIRKGLITNGLVKIPMQLLILGLGILLYGYYQLQPAPMNFNFVQEQQMIASKEYQTLKGEYEQKQFAKISLANEPIPMAQKASAIKEIEAAQKEIKTKALALTKRELNARETKDEDYVFLYFILNNLPLGIKGLLLAVIFSAAMSSTSAGLNSLGATTQVDFFVRLSKSSKSEGEKLRANRWFILLWGLICIGFALVFGLIDNLIQAVNILGSLFYGTILGIFLTGFFLKKVGSIAVIVGAVVAELVVVYCFYFHQKELSFMWYNVIACFIVMGLSLVVQKLFGNAWGHKKAD